MENIKFIKADIQRLNKLIDQIDEFHESDDQWDFEDNEAQCAIAAEFSQIIASALVKAKLRKHESKALVPGW
jgi:hypothetical protein